MVELRTPAELQFKTELEALAAQDRAPRPANWRLSPTAVVTYILGGALPDGTAISPKYVGSRRLVETAVATLLTDREIGRASCRERVQSAGVDGGREDNG